MDLQKSYINDGINNYLTVTLPDDHQINTYQLRLMDSMKTDFLLSGELRSDSNNNPVMYYNVNSRLDMAKTLENIGNLNKSRFVFFIRGLLQIFLTEKRQQLKTNYFILNPEYIFFHKKNNEELKPELVYLPVENLELDFVFQFKNLLRYLIPLKVNYSEDEAFYREILKALDDSSFTLNELQDILNSSKNESKPLHMPRNEAKQPEYITPKREPKPQKVEESYKKPEQPVKKPEPVAKKSVNEPSGAVSPALPTATGKKSLIIGLLQVLFVLFAAIILVGLEIKEPKGILGVLLILGALDALTVYMVNKKMPSAGITEKVPLSKKEIKKTNTKSFNDDKPQAEETRKEAAASVSQINEKTEFLFPAVASEEDDGKTVFLTQNARLVYTSEGTRKEILLDSNRKTKVGRSKSCNLVITKSTVSSLHAEIVVQNGEYYIQDLNSSNGTYLNGKRLTGDEQAKINNGDIITFAETDYTFMK